MRPYPKLPPLPKGHWDWTNGIGWVEDSDVLLGGATQSKETPRLHWMSARNMSVRILHPRGDTNAHNGRSVDMVQPVPVIPSWAIAPRNPPPIAYPSNSDDLKRYRRFRNEH